EQESYNGKRLYLTKTREEKNPELIESFRRRQHGFTSVQDENESKHLVYFHIDETRLLTGNKNNVL
ncbi:MAG: pyridoxamine 5'-phosphate oxidase family protein, partial [Deltaproteobacteria bacterium]|nr:pyridoxamine 5'-phosphate oxidase family protein [Deltaproteobacteria bacterium]